MQDSHKRAIMRAGVGMLVVAALALGGAGLWPAQAKQIVPSQTVVLVVVSQKVERIEDDAGNDLGPGAVEAAIKVGDGGWAKGQTRVTPAPDEGVV